MITGCSLNIIQEIKMNIAVIYDTKTNTTQKAAEFIREGILQVENAHAECFNIADADNDYVRAADGVIIGSPTYMASTSAAMQNWLQSAAQTLGLAGKLGGAYATEQYIHGGAENVINIILTHEMVYGMLVYSGGGSCGKPVIHLGPVGMSQNIEDFHELFTTYGSRFAAMAAKIKG